MHAGLFAICRSVSIIAVVQAAMLSPCPSRAEGALAIGLPSDVAHQGFAAGNALNDATADQARKNALDGCHASIDASDAAKKLCEVIMTFRNRCYAVAIDPKAGTPGVGWAVADSLKLADQQAIAECRKTAGADRRDYCVIYRPDNDHGCDGTAK
jgi:hypothetical protein